MKTHRPGVIQRVAGVTSHRASHAISRGAHRALFGLVLAGALGWSGCQSERSSESPEGESSAEVRAPSLPAMQGQADERAAEIADKVMGALGGQGAWNDTRYISWKFMGARQHYWDKWTGDIRIESNDVVILMNLNTKTGKVQKAGEEIVDGPTLASYLDRGYGWWVNDSYWMFMPFKLRDPGVHLVYAGERPLPNGKPADVLTMTFENVGLTPSNKYDVHVDRETNLVALWSYYEKNTDTEPQLTAPWNGWQRFGDLMLATQHGRGDNWEIHVYESLPPTVFQSFEAVQA